MGEFEDYLSHHGILGQKWGVRNALWYPIEAYRRSKTYLENVANSEGGKKVRSGAKKAAEATVRGTKKAASTTVRVAKNANEKRKTRAADKKARKVEEARIQREREDRERVELAARTKEEILKSGTPRDVLRIADELTNDELRYAIDRNRNLTSLKEAEAARIKAYNDAQHKKKWGTAIAFLNAYGVFGKSLASFADSTNNVRKFIELFEETEKDKKAKKEQRIKALQKTSIDDILNNLDNYSTSDLKIINERLGEIKKTRDYKSGKTPQGVSKDDFEKLEKRLKKLEDQ